MHPHPRRTLAVLVAGAAVAAVTWLGVAHAASSSVTVGDNDYRPATVTVDAGDTVTWRYDGQSVHTVTADDGSFDSGTLERGVPYSRRFDTPGTYGYYCTFHGAPGQGQAGTVVVRAGAAAVTTTTAPRAGSTTTSTRAGAGSTTTSTSAPSATTIPAQDIGFDDRSTATSALSLGPAAVPAVDPLAPLPDGPGERTAGAAAAVDDDDDDDDDDAVLVAASTPGAQLPDAPVVAGVVLIVAVLGALTSHLVHVE